MKKGQLRTIRPRREEIIMAKQREIRKHQSGLTNGERKRRATKWNDYRNTFYRGIVKGCKTTENCSSKGKQDVKQIRCITNEPSRARHGHALSRLYKTRLFMQDVWEYRNELEEGYVDFVVDLTVPARPCSLIQLAPAYWLK